MMHRLFTRWRSGAGDASLRKPDTGCRPTMSGLGPLLGAVAVLMNPAAAALTDQLPPLVYVQRQIPDQGTIYWGPPRTQLGVGAHSRVRPAPPGRLMVRESNGSLRILIDGANPQSNAFQLVDVNSPAVSWDGQTIVFSAIPQGNYPLDPARNPGAWRLYAIQADGSNLRQITLTDITADYSPLGQGSQPWAYDDYDPVFLPDGRIVFASTRWPGFGHYSGVRSSNLWVVDADGGRLHRITSERNGADRPLVDPITGKIVFSRWWRNHRFATHDTTTVAANCGGGNNYPYPCYQQHEGLTIDRNNHVGGADALFRNAWQSSFINLDGSGLAMFSGVFRNEADNHVYGGAFTADGELLANFYPQFNMTEAAGFGGIRRYQRGSQRYQPVNGITRLTLQYVHCPTPNDCSYGVYVPPAEGYTSDPVPLADGRIIYSAAPDHLQDYGLWVLSADGQSYAPLLDQAGTAEMRAQALVARPVPPILPDPYRDNWANTLKPEHIPPPQDGPYDRDGSFVFDALNVYFNAPVDSGIVSAPAVGTAASIRFYLDHQRRTTGSFPTQDWPILLNELPISPAGRVRESAAPAFLPMFEQLRTLATAGYQVPLTGGPYTSGAAHVAGMNYNRDGVVARCVGCHAGHTQIPIPPDPSWTNLAPGAALEVSSARDPQFTGGLIDRRVNTGEIFRYWNSASGQSQDGQWVELVFPVPVLVREVRLYNPRFGDEANSTIQVHQARVRLFAEPGFTQPLAQATATELSVSGTSVNFNDVRARVVRIDLDDVSGTFYGLQIASLAEVEVIARGDGLLGDDEIHRDSFE